MNSATEKTAHATATEDMLAASERAFYQSLPVLLKSQPRRWVAFHGDKLLGSGPTQTVLFQQCLSRGLSPSEFVVLFVSEAALHDHDEIDLPTTF